MAEHHLQAGQYPQTPTTLGEISIQQHTLRELT